LRRDASVITVGTAPAQIDSAVLDRRSGTKITELTACTVRLRAYCFI
jgi:hypothetical protein